MALTKNDLQKIKFIIKKGLKGFSTKSDLKRFITKDDLKYLPTKDDFYQKMDEVMGELQTIREEQTMLSGIQIKVNDHEDRIEVIEDKLNLTAPAAA